MIRDVAEMSHLDYDMGTIDAGRRRCERPGPGNERETFDAW